MNEKKFHQLIEDRNSEEKEALRRRVRERLNIPDETEEIHKKVSAKRSFFKKPYRLVTSLSSAFAICLAIAIPIVLNNGTSAPAERYCYAADCVKTEIDYSLKEYSERNGLSFLYIDWYDIADEIQTKLYVNVNDDSDIMYFQETIVNGETGSLVVLSITDLHTKVDVFEVFDNICENIEDIASIQVNWSFQNFEGKAYFEYSGYRYFIELSYTFEENSILELVESMLPKT